MKVNPRDPSFIPLPVLKTLGSCNAHIVDEFPCELNIQLMYFSFPFSKLVCPRNFPLDYSRKVLRICPRVIRIQEGPNRLTFKNKPRACLPHFCGVWNVWERTRLNVTGKVRNLEGGTTGRNTVLIGKGKFLWWMFPRLTKEWGKMRRSRLRPWVKAAENIVEKLSAPLRYYHTIVLIQNASLKHGL